MNERIKELAEQAQQYAEYITPQGLEWFPAFKEKFAELIVRECARVYWNIDDSETHTEYVEALKQHFGVK